MCVQKRNGNSNKCTYKTIRYPRKLTVLIRYGTIVSLWKSYKIRVDRLVISISHCEFPKSEHDENVV